MYRQPLCLLNLLSFQLNALKMNAQIVVSINLLMVLFLCVSFLITYASIPSIIGVIIKKNLMDSPNQRSAHKKDVPTMGGIAFFLTFMLSFFFLKRFDMEDTLIALIPGLSILFILGLKDDLVGVAPLTKLLAQLIACLFVVTQDGMYVDTLNGFLGINEISKAIAYPMSCFLMIMVINAFNLIDGVDGLASIIGIIISLIYALMLYYVSDYLFCLLSLTVVGVLLAFLRYNFSNSGYKIFMGDTGSLIIGFIISALTIRFLATPNVAFENFPFTPDMVPLVVLSILIVPLFDSFRVFVIRIFNRKNPFSADKNHIHHVITALGFSHKQTSIIVGISNVLFVLVFLLFSSSSNSYIPLIIIFALSIAGLVYLFYKIDLRFSSLKKRILIKRKIDNTFFRKPCKKKPPEKSPAADEENENSQNDPSSGL